LEPEGIDLDEQHKLDEVRRSRVLLQNMERERTESLISQLVHDYRSDTLVHDKMVGCIAEIAGMRTQIDKLTRYLRGAQ